MIRQCDWREENREVSYVDIDKNDLWVANFKRSNDIAVSLKRQLGLMDSYWVNVFIHYDGEMYVFYICVSV